MRIPLLTLATALVITPVIMAQDTKAPETQEEKISYAIGSQIGSSLKADEVAIVPEQFLAGVLDAIEGKEAKLTPEQMQQTMMALQQELQQKQMEKATAAAEENTAAGKKFLEENGKKEGVVTTKSGLQYKVIEEGKGEKPTATDKITAHYHGTLIDGTVFDSSVNRGEPIQFPVSGVIAGWTEALQLMPVGSKWRLFIPSDLAYGERGAGGDIGPNSTLIFDVELISID